MSATASPTISFARGVPSADLLPVDDLAAAVQQALVEAPAAALAYGTADGYGPLRDWIAERYGVPSDRVFLTNGSLQGMAFLFEHLFARSGGRAVVEAPTYDRALTNLARFGATAEALTLEADGLDLDALEAAIADGRTPGVVYVIPNFQNPGGVTMSRAKRERLVALAATHGFWLLEDDPYRDLRFAGADEPTMLGLDRDDRVIHSLSFTKTVAPGVRVGAMILPAPLLAPMRKLATDTYIGPTQLTQAAVHAYCRAGRFDANLERVRPALRERRDTLVASLREHLGDRAQFDAPEGGYFLWVRLPGIDADALADRAGAAGVPVVKGSGCYPDGRGRDAIRLAFSAVRPGEMEAGVARLAALL